jgi:hypothetical protein
MNCRRVLVPFITCGNNRLSSGRLHSVLLRFEFLDECSEGGKADSPRASWPLPDQLYSRRGEEPGLMRKLQQRRPAMKVKEVMHKGVDWVSPDTPVTELAKLAADSGKEAADRGAA